MKKLIVLALSTMMILSVAAVSMAAVTMGGEVNYGWQLSDPQGNMADAKLSATAKLNDEVSGFVAFKAATTSGATLNEDFGNVGVDETWAKFTEGWGSVQVGYWGQNIKDNMDILAPMADIKNSTAIKVTGNVADHVTVMGYLSRPNNGTDNDVNNDYVLSAAYATDAFGVDGYYVGSSEDGFEAITAVNAFYNIAPAKLYVNYTTQDDNSVAYVGAMVDSEKIPVYGRVEAQVQKPDSQDSNALGFRVGYKLGNGAKIEYNSVDTGLTGADTDKTSSIKLNLVF